jgi:hypothetical protein
MALNNTFTADLDARLQQLRDDRVYKQLNYHSTHRSGARADGGTAVKTS